MTYPTNESAMGLSAVVASQCLKLGWDSVYIWEGKNGGSRNGWGCLLRAIVLGLSTSLRGLRHFATLGYRDRDSYYCRACDEICKIESVLVAGLHGKDGKMG